MKNEDEDGNTMGRTVYKSIETKIGPNQKSDKNNNIYYLNGVRYVDIGSSIDPTMHICKYS